MKRKYYIDNLRWLMILLLFPFHALQIWSGGKYGGFYIWSHTNSVMYAISTAMYPWYMTLLFVIAGMSSRYALLKRTPKQFIAERTKKLLIPFLFGVIVLAPIMTCIAEMFFNGYTGSYLYQLAQFTLIVVLSFVTTIIVYEIIKRIPYIRILFGISEFAFYRQKRYNQK